MTFWSKLAGLTAFLVAIAGLYAVIHPTPPPPNNVLNASGCASITVNQEKRALLQKKVSEGRKMVVESKVVRLDPKGSSLPQEQSPQEAQLEQLEQEIRQLNVEIEKSRQLCGG